MGSCSYIVVSSLQGLAGLHLGSGQWRSPVSCNVCGHSGQCGGEVTRSEEGGGGGYPSSQEEGGKQ